MARRTSRTSLQPARPSGSSPSGSSPPGRSRTCSENVGTDPSLEFGTIVFSAYVNVIIPIDRLDVFSTTTGAATSMPTSRWFAVGSAGESEPEAGLRAADEALVHDDAKLLVAFCSASHDLAALARQIRTRSGGGPLVGCTTAGEIATSGPREASVVVAALGGDGFVIETAVATGASKDLRGAG